MLLPIVEPFLFFVGQTVKYDGRPLVAADAVHSWRYWGDCLKLRGHPTRVLLFWYRRSILPDVSNIHRVWLGTYMHILLNSTVVNRSLSHPLHGEAETWLWQWLVRVISGCHNVCCYLIVINVHILYVTVYLLLYSNPPRISQLVLQSLH